MKYYFYIEFKVLVNLSKDQCNLLMFTSVYPLSAKVHNDNLNI